MNIIPAINDKNRSIREAFSDSMLAVLSKTGANKFNEMTPFVRQLLSDSNPFVIYRMLINLSKMVERRLLDKSSLVSIIKDYMPQFFLHSSLWVRHGAVHFVCKIYQTNQIMSLDEVLSIFQSVLQDSLTRCDISVFERPEVLFACLKPSNPIPFEEEEENREKSESEFHVSEISTTRFLDIANCQINFETTPIQHPHPDWSVFLDVNSNKTTCCSDINVKPRGSLRTNGLVDSDCLVEFKRYQDRFAMVYEDHLVKYSRVLNHKHAINSSLCSNHVRLTDKNWRPKGQLVVNAKEHTQAIDQIVRNSDSTFVASLSSSEQCVKIWPLDPSTLLAASARSGLYQSVFTYSNEWHVRNSTGAGTDFRPACLTFYDKSSLAVLSEDFGFYLIDVDSNRTMYKLSLYKNLFNFGTNRAHFVDEQKQMFYLKRSFSTNSSNNRQSYNMSNGKQCNLILYQE